MASKVNPTLSSIWANPNELGEKALQTALVLVKGEKAGSMVLPTRFIMRESIGGVNSHLDISEEEYETMIASYVDSVFYTARDENYQSYTKLISDIDFLRIQNAGIYLFEKPLTYLQKDKFVCPDQLYLKAILENGMVRSVPGARQRVAKKDLFHLAELSGSRSNLVCLPLFSNEMLYGLLICDLTL